jgi:hypothetical protein
MSVARAQDEISATEFGRWLVFDRLELGEPGRTDARFASLAYWIFKGAGGKGDVTMRGFLHKFLTDFQLVEAEPRPEQSTADARRIMQLIANRQNAVVAKRQGKRPPPKSGK